MALACTAPPCPGAERHRGVARQMCARTGQMWSGTPRVRVNLGSLRSASLLRQGTTAASSRAATCVPCPRECREEQVRTWCLLSFPLDMYGWKQLDPEAGGKESFVLPLTGSKGGSQRVNGVFSAQMYKWKKKKKAMLSFPEIRRTQKNVAKVFPSCKVLQYVFYLLPLCLLSLSGVGDMRPDYRRKKIGQRKAG